LSPYLHASTLTKAAPELVPAMKILRWSTQ
jgi:hypothetical protein